MGGQVKHSIPRYPEKIIGEIHLSGILALVYSQSQHEYYCITRYNRGIFSK